MGGIFGPPSMATLYGLSPTENIKHTLSVDRADMVRAHKALIAALEGYKAGKLDKLEAGDAIRQYLAAVEIAQRHLADYKGYVLSVANTIA